MREISVREFQQTFHKQIKYIPFVVTKRGEPLFVVTLPEDDNEDKVVTSIKSKPKVVTLLKDKKKEQVVWKFTGTCKHGFAYGLCKRGCVK